MILLSEDCFEYPSPWKYLGLDFKDTPLFPKCILFKACYFLGRYLHPISHMLNVNHGLDNTESQDQMQLCWLQSEKGKCHCFREPSTRRYQVSMASLSAVISKMLWCCTNVVGVVQHGWGDTGSIGDLAGCWGVNLYWSAVVNSLYPCRNVPSIFQGSLQNTDLGI